MIFTCLYDGYHTKKENCSNDCEFETRHVISTKN